MIILYLFDYDAQEQNEFCISLFVSEKENKQLKKIFHLILYKVCEIN